MESNAYPLLRSGALPRDPGLGSVSPAQFSNGSLVSLAVIVTAQIAVAHHVSKLHATRTSPDRLKCRETGAKHPKL